MNTLRNNLTKQCITIFLIHSIVATSYLHAMKPDSSKFNNSISVINKHDELVSLMALAYTETELLPPSSPKTTATKFNDFGRLYQLNMPQTISCNITKHDTHDCTSLGIFNPRTKKQIHVQAVYSKDNSSLKIYYRPKRIVLTTSHDNFSFLQIYNAGLEKKTILLAAYHNDIITIKKDNNDDIRITINNKKIKKDSDYIEY